MSGRIYRRCSRCGKTAKERTCRSCGNPKVTWAYVADVGWDGQGNRLRQSRSGFPTKRDAERALVEVRSSITQGSFVRTSHMTVSDYLLKEWLPATSPPRTRHETWDDRRRNLTLHVLPNLGDLALQQLNAAQLNRLYSDLLEGGRLDGEGGLSPTSVRRVHSMLRKAFNDAVRWGLLAKNPTQAADPPPERVVRASMRRGMQTWTAAELNRFLTSTAGDQHHVLWRTAAGTGMRRSELLGARWADTNLSARTLTVRQTMVKTPTGYEPVLLQKSVQSARTIHLDAGLAELLTGHRRHQREIARQAGGEWNPHRLLFPRADGGWWNPPAITLAFVRAVQRADVPRIRLHDLRHTHATLLLTAGVNPKVVSERLGHSSVAFTLDTYAHVLPGMQPETAELFARLIDPPEPEGS